MKRRFERHLPEKGIWTGLACLLLTGLIGCAGSGAPAAATTDTLPQAAQSSVDADTDQAADTTEAAQERVVALSRSAGELWLLAGGTLAGITEDGLELEGISPDITLTGTNHKPNREAVIGLAPTLVLYSGSISAQTELASFLEEQGVETLSADMDSFADYDALMQTLCARTGRDDLYAGHVTDVAREIEAVRSQVAERGAADASYLALQISATKNKALKKDYFACEIFDDLGLHNIAEDASALNELSVEAVLAADPAYIFLIPMGTEEEARDSYEQAFAANPAWQSLSAVQADHVYDMPKELFRFKPGARWGEAYRYAFDLIYGGNK
ncbi:MAG: ABC transporter substrate-binding protein [Butyrivibrio sp.]|nr:ABC transporter substrate-binding protein [Butyrivibrio sp.]